MWPMGGYCVICLGGLWTVWHVKALELLDWNACVSALKDHEGYFLRRVSYVLSTWHVGPFSGLWYMGYVLLSSEKQFWRGQFSSSGHVRVIMLWVPLQEIFWVSGHLWKDLNSSGEFCDYPKVIIYRYASRAEVQFSIHLVCLAHIVQGTTHKRQLVCIMGNMGWEMAVDQFEPMW
jgi:hypothetical protein